METPPSSRVLHLPCLAYNRGNCSDAPVLFSLSERKAVPVRYGPSGGQHYLGDPARMVLGSPPYPCHLPLEPQQRRQDPAAASAGRCAMLSDKPGAADGCVVVLLDKMDPVLWYCHVVGAGGWARHEYDIGTQILYPDETLHEKLVIAPVTSCRGKLYFSTGFEELGVLEFRPAPAFSSVAMREVVVTGGYGVAHSALVFMVESKGQVHMVNLLFEGSFSNVVYEMSVYRVDFAEQEWRRVHDLEGQAFLLSAVRFGASRPAGECGLEEDCVYVAGYPRDKDLMIYNVKEATMKMETLEEAPHQSGTPLTTVDAAR